MRTAEFDRAEVLEQAMLLFRTHGYARTTVQALVAATGLHPGSIYAAFGNKRGLLDAVIEHYLTGKQAQRQQMLQQASALAGIEAYLHYLREQGQAGTCVVMRSVIELSGAGEEQCQVFARMERELRDDLQQTLQRAVMQQEIPGQTDVSALTAYLLLVIRGMTSQAGCQASEALPMSVISCVMAALTAGGEATRLPYQSIRKA